MKKVISNLNEKGIFTRFNDTLPANISIPGGLLAQVSPESIETILSYRAGDEVLGGRRKVIDWADQDYYIPDLSITGSTTPYADTDDSSRSGVTLDFGRTGHYRFSTMYSVGELEAEQVARSKNNLESRSLNASLEILAIEFNRVAFNGYANANGDFVVNGLLNNPNLNNYEAAPKTFATMTWDEAVSFFGTAFAKLQTQTGNNLQRGSKVRIAVAAGAMQILLNKRNQFGVSVLNGVIDTYKALGIELEFTSAIELENANGGLDVIYFILENDKGGMDWTAANGYSEIARFGRVVYGSTFMQQKVSAGSVGAIITKPAYVVRYSGI